MSAQGSSAQSYSVQVKCVQGSDMQGWDAQMSSAQGSDAQGAGAQGSVAQGQNCLGAGHGVGRGICRSFAISSAILRQASVLEANCCNCFAMSWGGPPNRRASGGGRTINMFSMDVARENITYKLSHQLSILWFRWHGGVQTLLFLWFRLELRLLNSRKYCISCTFLCIFTFLPL